MGRLVLGAIGALSVIYSLAVLTYVATSPDFGIRCLLEERDETGTPIVLVSGSHGSIGGKYPAAGDKLIRVGGRPTPTFAHYLLAMTHVRGVTPRGGLVSNSADLRTHAEILPPVVARETNGRTERLVEVVFSRTKPDGTSETLRDWLLVGSVPTPEVALTFVWFVLQLSIFLVAALAFWKRPFDRHARLFFAMCSVSLGAFVGGFHWWLIAGTVWLTVPFVVSGVMMPVITLHFFLVYPEPKAFVRRHPVLTRILLYGLPTVVLLTLSALVVIIAWQLRQDLSVAVVHATLRILGASIYVYLAIAAGYYLATLLALLDSVRTTRSPLVQQQVKGILWAATSATLPVAYTMYLALFYKVDFAFGTARLPMFAASLLFMIAYGVAIMRHKLMLLDEVVSRGMLYYVATAGVSLFSSGLIAAVVLFGLTRSIPVWEQSWLLAGTVLVGVLMLQWVRVRLQEQIDRSFFREKYQLDRALPQIRVDGNRVGPAEVASRMLASCHDVLGAETAAFFLQEGDGEAFRLIAARGTQVLPESLSAESVLSRPARDDSSDAGTSGEHSILQQLRFELAHVLDSSEAVKGLLLLGPRTNGQGYSAGDLTFLTTLGQITTVALQSAREQQLIERLNEELHSQLSQLADQQRLITMLQSELTARKPVAGDLLPSSNTEALEPGPATEPQPTSPIRGNSSAIREVLETVRKVASSPSSVLIRGESGTGKELLAQAIHDNSVRRAAPLVSVHCGALSASLLESELFGHVKGAFTGAHKDRIGRFEMAHGGTLFLDEIGDISLETQVKLLRVLQERSFEPVGSSRTVQVDVRLVAATHQNLERLIASGGFREDLFYRLNVISITLPALRERGDDVLELALHFLAASSRAAEKQITHFNEAAMHALLAYNWPGNVRELQNVIERAVVLSEGPAVTLQDLPPQIAALRAQPGAIPVRDLAPRLLTAARSIPASLAVPDAGAPGALDHSAERDSLIQALARAGGNKAEAARLLAMPRSTFFSKLKKHSLV